MLGIVSSGHADTLNFFRAFDKTNQSDSKVTIVQLTRNAQGKKVFIVNFHERGEFPVELEHVYSVTFGLFEEGTEYNATIGNPGNAAIYNRALFKSYKGGRFVAKPANENIDYYLKLDDIQSMQISDPSLVPGARGGAPPGGQPGNPGANPNDPFGNSGAGAPPAGNDPFSNPGGNSGSDDTFGTGAGSSDDGSGSDDSFDFSSSGNEELDDLFSEMSDEDREQFEQSMANIDKLAGKALILAGVGILYLILWTITTIWLTINAFMSGETGWGIGLCCSVLLCLTICLPVSFFNSPIKAFYMSRYEGKGKAFANVLVIIEIIIWIGMSWFSRSIANSLGV